MFFLLYYFSWIFIKSCMFSFEWIFWIFLLIFSFLLHHIKVLFSQRGGSAPNPPLPHQGVRPWTRSLPPCILSFPLQGAFQNKRDCAKIETTEALFRQIRVYLFKIVPSGRDTLFCAIQKLFERVFQIIDRNVPQDVGTSLLDGLYGRKTFSFHGQMQFPE